MLSPELATELRAARPTASAGLRERVLEIAAREQPPRPRRFPLPPLRRVALFVAPAALALAIGGALVHGLTHSGQNRAVSEGAGRVRPLPHLQPQKGALAAGRGPESHALLTAAPHTAGRLQQYGAYLRLQAKDVAA